MPKVAPPEELDDTATVIRKYIEKPGISDGHRQALEKRLQNVPTAFEMRPVDPMSYICIKATPPHGYLWVKATGKIGTILVLKI